MVIEMVINPKAEGYAEFVQDFEDELKELKGLTYKRVEVPAPPKSLGIEHDVVKLIFGHFDSAVRLVVALIQITQAVIERGKKPEEPPKKGEPGEPIAVLTVDDRNMPFPSSEKAQRNLVEAVKKGKTKKQSKKASNKRKKPKPRKARRNPR